MTMVSTVPSPQQAPAPPAFARYMQATRAYSFPASIAPVLLAAALAFRGYGTIEPGGDFSGVLFALTLVGAILAQAGGNVLNDYYDFVRGVDTRPEHGSGVLPAGLLSAPQMLRFGVVLLLGAALCGTAIVLLRPDVLPLVALFALVGFLCAVLYTPLLKKRALGDIVIMTAFGLGLTLGAYLVQTRLTNSFQAGLILILSLPVTLLVDAILHANNIRDAGDDAGAGVRTVASLLGPQKSQAFQAILLFGPVALVVLFVLLRLLPVSCFATVLALPLLIKGFKSGDVPFVAQSHLVFGVLYALSVALMARP